MADDYKPSSADLMRQASSDPIGKQRAGINAARAQAPDTFKGDLVADDRHSKLEAERAEAAKVAATLEDKFGPSKADLEAQERVIDAERSELQRKAAPFSQGPAPAALASIAKAYFAKR